MTKGLRGRVSGVRGGAREAGFVFGEANFGGLTTARDRAFPPGLLQGLLQKRLFDGGVREFGT